MNSAKQGMAAVALVTSLGLIAPGSLGGSALADSSSSLGHNRQQVPRELYCDVLDGAEVYETRYEVVATKEHGTWQDRNSTTVLKQRLWVDVLGETYTALPAEDGHPAGVDFVDKYPVYWWDGPPNDYSQGGGKPTGWQTVRCTGDVQSEYEATADDLVDAPDLPFVYDATTGKGARYQVTTTKLYDVEIIGATGPKKGGTAQAAGAERKAKAKKGGKHPGKGKRGR